MWSEWSSKAQITELNVTRKFDRAMLMLKDIANNTSSELAWNMEENWTILGRIVDDRENKKTIFIPANELSKEEKNGL